MLSTYKMLQYSVGVRSVVSVCLRFVRPSLPNLGQLPPPAGRLYSNSAHRSAKAKAATKQKPLPGSVLEDNLPLEKKSRASETVSGLTINRHRDWTEKKVALLNEGAELRQTSGWTWEKVAELVGDGVSANQCRSMWSRLNKKYAGWGDKEVALLTELVEKHTDPVTKQISWKDISTALNRPANQIHSKWNNVRSTKAVRFTPEQDALIQKHVAAWGVKGVGVWASLQREMGFRAIAIRQRYYRLVAGTSNMVYFTPEMDQVIIDELKNQKPGSRVKSEKWHPIAARVGPNVTAEQCRVRWAIFLKHKACGRRVGVVFTAVEVARIMEFAEEHVTNIPWTQLGKELNVIPYECNDKWRATRQLKLKKGRFSAEEDALLMQRAKEFGDPKLRRGLWAALEKEMNRPADTLLKRWKWLCIVGTGGVGVATK